MVQAARSIEGLKLSDRARSRVEQERDVQKVTKPHDIRNMIPKVAWTDPANFPPYLYREFPKMPLLDGNQPIKINEVGDLLLFFSAEDEQEFKDLNPELAEEIERNEPAKLVANVVATLTDEVSELRARLRAAGIDDGAKKPKPGATAGVVRQAQTETSGEQPSGGLREHLKQAAGEGAASAQGSNPLKNKKKDKAA